MNTATSDQDDLKRRMKAALALAGITVEELAERIGQRGYGAKSLYNMQGEKGERPIRAQDMEVIARACGLSPSFFTIDFSALPDTSADDRLAALENQMALVARAVMHPDSLDDLTQALADLGLADDPSQEEAPSGGAGTDRRHGAAGDAGA